MTETPQDQLAGFIGKYSDDIAALANDILARMRELYPTAHELVYDNYNALAVGFAPSSKTSEAIFSIAVYPKWVCLFFLQAKGVPDPDNLLKGNGTVAKHIVVKSVTMLEESAIQLLMQKALDNAVVPLDPDGQYALIIKSVSEKQRPRRPA